MKKKLISLLLVLVMPMLVLCGCGRNQTTQLQQEEYLITEILDGITLVCIAKPKSQDGYRVYVHKETRVMYLVYAYSQYGKNSSYGHYGITPLLNADGSPMLYEGEL